jgi:hypothetical protein
LGEHRRSESEAVVLNQWPNAFVEHQGPNAMEFVFGLTSDVFKHEFWIVWGERFLLLGSSSKSEQEAWDRAAAGVRAGKYVDIRTM